MRVEFCFSPCTVSNISIHSLYYCSFSVYSWLCVSTENDMPFRVPKAKHSWSSKGLLFVESYFFFDLYGQFFVSSSIFCFFFLFFHSIKYLLCLFSIKISQPFLFRVCSTFDLCTNFFKVFLDALGPGLFHFWPYFNCWVSVFNILFTIDSVNVFIFLTKKFSQLHRVWSKSRFFFLKKKRKIMSGLYWNCKGFIF